MYFQLNCPLAKSLKCLSTEGNKDNGLNPLKLNHLTFAYFTETLDHYSFPSSLSFLNNLVLKPAGGTEKNRDPCWPSAGLVGGDAQWLKVGWQHKSVRWQHGGVSLAHAEWEGNEGTALQGLRVPVTVSATFLPKMHNLSLIMEKCQTKLNWKIFHIINANVMNVKERLRNCPQPRKLSRYDHKRELDWRIR